MRLESPKTLICFTPMLSAMTNPVRYASYSVALFEWGNSSLKDNSMVSLSSQLSTIPRPFEVDVADLSNLMTHFFPRSFVTANSPKVSSLSEHFSSLGNWASKP